jgi:hypothetical protein
MSDIDFGDKQFRGVGFPTPVSIPDDTTCRTVIVPASGDWLALVMGALEALAEPFNWQQLEGGISRDDAAGRARQMIDDTYDLAEEGTCETEVEAPYWDQAADVAASVPVSSQTWYGKVSDTSAPPAEITFIEQIAIWAFAGFIAYAGQPGAAIFFLTVAPKFILAWKRGDVGELFRIVIDTVEYGTVDTSAYAPGEIVTYTVVTNPDADSPHPIYIIKVS